MCRAMPFLLSMASRQATTRRDHQDVEADIVRNHGDVEGISIPIQTLHDRP